MIISSLDTVKSKTMMGVGELIPIYNNHDHKNSQRYILIVMVSN
jgi:hypothetical protein